MLLISTVSGFNVVADWFNSIVLRGIMTDIAQLGKNKPVYVYMAIDTTLFMWENVFLSFVWTDPLNVDVKIHKYANQIWNWDLQWKLKNQKEDCGCIGSSQVGVHANYMNVKSDGDDKEHAIQALTSLKSNL